MVEKTELTGSPIRVWLSVYACEPDRGSEPGVGWKWANGLARRVELTVLTRCSNRKEIERALEESEVDDPIRKVKFVYHDLPGWVLFLKKRGLPVMLYHALWQWSVYREYRDALEGYDIVHHLTFCTLLCPGFWADVKPAFVIGPVGAPVVADQYYPLFGSGKFLQRLRGGVMRRFDRLPWLRRVLKEAALIVPANSDTKALLESRGFPAADVLLDTGSTSIEGEAESSGDDQVRFLYAGSLLRRKGLELSLRALARAAGEAGEWRFVVVGDGPDRKRLEGLAEELGIGDRVEFLGVRTHEETLKEMTRSDVFLFASVRDTSAGVNLEAMACGLPVVCINHQGVGDITDDECAIRVPPGSIEETIEGLSAGIVRMATDEALRNSMAERARERANRDFLWEEKFERMIVHYERLRDKA